MKQILASVLLLSMISFGVVGCTDKTSATKETAELMPGETATVTVDEEVIESGDEHSPAER